MLERFIPRGPLRVVVLPSQEPRAMAAVYAQADAFVFPTCADEWGVVVNEALAAGLPVLGSIHSQAVEELCADGETGWLFDPEDASTVLAALDRALAASGEELAAMGARARARARPDARLGRRSNPRDVRSALLAAGSARE